MTYQTITLEQPESGIYVIAINRPKALNALHPDVFNELEHAVSEINADDKARVLLVTGTGDKAFVAGADIKAMADMGTQEAMNLSDKGHKVFRSLELLPIPVIAVVNGYALGGGCELALSCDWILASEHAVFGQPEVNLGILAGWGGTQRLPRRVGAAMALELLCTGQQIKAEEALRIGLANHVYPAAELMSKAMAMARTIAAKGPIAVRYSKQLVHRGLDVDLAKACTVETALFGLVFGTKDKSEGVTAFIEKRPAQFQGK